MIVANHINMGQRNSDQGRFPEAIDHFQAARALCQSLLKHSGPNRPIVGPLARVRLAAIQGLSPEREIRRVDCCGPRGRVALSRAAR